MSETFIPSNNLILNNTFILNNGVKKSGVIKPFMIGKTQKDVVKVLKTLYPKIKLTKKPGNAHYAIVPDGVTHVGSRLAKRAPHLSNSKLHVIQFSHFLSILPRRMDTTSSKLSLRSKLSQGYPQPSNDLIPNLRVTENANNFQPDYIKHLHAEILTETTNEFDQINNEWHQLFPSPSAPPPQYQQRSQPPSYTAPPQQSNTEQKSASSPDQDPPQSPSFDQPNPDMITYYDILYYFQFKICGLFDKINDERRKYLNDISSVQSKIFTNDQMQDYIRTLFNVVFILQNGIASNLTINLPEYKNSIEDSKDFCQRIALFNSRILTDVMFKSRELNGVNIITHFDHYDLQNYIEYDDKELKEIRSDFSMQKLIQFVDNKGLDGMYRELFFGVWYILYMSDILCSALNAAYNILELDEYYCKKEVYIDDIEKLKKKYFKKQE